ncbi:MAG TPA: hypothetical protein VFW29_11770 [Solirubrobacteraceae bacterium]|nr:hypothetical protein [Solirubrobacteraceae bacterium]
MLFDLRGRGRRRTVRLVYGGLAVLIGVGLIGFGVGGGFGSGGILSAASNNEGSSTLSFSNQIKKYRKQIKQQPKNVAAWEGLVKAQLQESNQFTQNGVTDKGKEVFAEVAQSWQSYLALNPPKPNSTLASQMVLVYSEEGLNQPTQAEAALQILVGARPTSASLWAQLAEYAYKAKDVHTGDLAAAKAVALAPSAERTRIQSLLAELRKNPNAAAERSYTTTTNGKTYVVKKAANGSFTGTEVKSPPPAATTTTKK